MKPVVAIAILCALFLALSACGDDAEEPPTASPVTTKLPTESPFNPPMTPAPTRNPPGYIEPTPTITPARDSPIPTTTYQPQLELLTDFVANRARWDAAGILNYQYEFTLACFCGFRNQPITIVVRDGQPVSLTNSLGEYLSGREYDIFLKYSTVDRLFVEFETTILERDPLGVEVSYDGQYGFPTMIKIGSLGGASDSGSVMTIPSLEVLP